MAPRDRWLSQRLKRPGRLDVEDQSRRASLDLMVLMLVDQEHEIEFPKPTLLADTRGNAREAKLTY